MMKQKQRSQKRYAGTPARFHLACELVKVIHHYFPGHLSVLKRLTDTHDQSYINNGKSQGDCVLFI